MWSDLVGRLGAFFSYDSLEPLLFTGVDFWVFFALVWAGYLLVFGRLRLRSLYLLVVSLLFYYKSCGLFFFLIVLSIFFNHGMVLWIHALRGPRLRRLLMSVTVGANLLMLAYFKYTGFFVGAVNQFFGTNIVFNGPLSGLLVSLLGVEVDVARTLILPVGISFYTFQAISYVVDTYRREVEPLRSVIDFGFYLSFFPSLVAGPIVRAREFVPQIALPYQVNVREASHALYLILLGLVKKVILSDYVALNLVDRVFETPTAYSAVENLLAMYGYTLQIYCDFSGYTDMAIGIALLLGFRLPINFNLPYRAVTITDFWRRWHISLSAWLRDYLYIPLGGNRKGRFRQNLNLFVTMLLGGLWHGASWNFVIWGGAHGLLLIVSKLLDRWLPVLRRRRVLVFVRGVIVFHAVAALWVLFRARTLEQGLGLFDRLFSGIGFSHTLEILSGYAHVSLLILLGYTLHFLPLRWVESARGAFIRSHVAVKWSIALAVVLVVLYYQGAGLQPFIYFAF